jgi:NADH:ubiquinone reductase (H+-translocating)
MTHFLVVGICVPLNATQRGHMSVSRKSPPPLPHIVVIGGGFGGMRFVRSIPPNAARITLIDRQNHHLFQPLLYQVATAGLSAVDVAQPIRAVFSDRKNFAALMAEVTGFDLGARVVTHTRGTLSYDYLVVAAGGATSYFGHPEWEKFAPGLKCLDDALRIRRQVLCSFERAETEPDPARCTELMTVVVVGGGPTGVELAGNFAELSRTVLNKDFDHIDPTRARVLLVNAGPRVLETFSPPMSASAQQQLEKLGVEVRNNARVEMIREGEVVVAGETIRAGNIIWAAGVTASPLGKLLGAPTDRSGRVLILPDLSLPGHPEVFVVGDIAALIDAKGVAVPGVAQGAIQMGAHAAKIISHEIRVARNAAEPAPRPPFAYFDKGSMATIGRSAAVAEIRSLQLSGTLAWLAWLGVHLLFLVGLRNKISVLIQWIYSYFTYKRGARVITGVSGEKAAGSA